MSSVAPASGRRLLEAQVARPFDLQVLRRPEPGAIDHGSARAVPQQSGEAAHRHAARRHRACANPEVATREGRSRHGTGTKARASRAQAASDLAKLGPSRRSARAVERT